jgi:hypothetical protein
MCKLESYKCPLSTTNKATMPKTQEKDELYKNHKKRMSYSLLQKNWKNNS